MFTMENTSGYTQEGLDRLNGEFIRRYNDNQFIWKNGKLMTMDEARQYFADEVSRRTGPEIKTTDRPDGHRITTDCRGGKVWGTRPHDIELEEELDIEIIDDRDN